MTCSLPSPASTHLSSGHFCYELASLKGPQGLPEKWPRVLQKLKALELPFFRSSRGRWLGSEAVQEQVTGQVLILTSICVVTTLPIPSC